MKAPAWHGKGDIRCDSVPDPGIEHGGDAIIKVTAFCDKQDGCINVALKR
jgi:hypothetical protein